MVPSRLRLVRLPQEVLDHIIDLVHNDIDSLKACALVARNWTPSSHYHLFSTVLCNPCKPGRTVEEVLVWAASDGTRVSRYATTLVVQPLRKSHRSFQYSFRMADMELLMMRLPNVRRVTFRDVLILPDIASNSSGLRTGLHPRHYARLSVISCRTPRDSSKLIADLLHIFPVLGQLQFVNTDCSEQWYQSSEATSLFTFLCRRARLTDLYIDCGEGDSKTSYQGYLELCRIMQANSRLGPLQRLGLALPRTVESSPLDSFLSHCPRSLVDLRVDVVPGMRLVEREHSLLPPPLQWRSRVLTEFQSLDTLRLNFLTFSTISNLQDEYNDILGANVELVLCAPPQLPMIIITIVLIGPWDAEAANVVRGLAAWIRLDKALLRLGHLKSVICQIWTGMDGVLDQEAQIDLLCALPDTSSPSYRLLTPSEMDDGTYPGVLASCLPGACSAGLLWAVMMN